MNIFFNAIGVCGLLFALVAEGCPEKPKAYDGGVNWKRYLVRQSSAIEREIASPLCLQEYTESSIGFFDGKEKSSLKEWKYFFKDPIKYISRTKTPERNLIYARYLAYKGKVDGYVTFVESAELPENASNDVRVEYHYSLVKVGDYGKAKALEKITATNLQKILCTNYLIEGDIVAGESCATRATNDLLAQRVFHSAHASLTNRYFENTISDTDTPKTTFYVLLNLIRKYYLVGDDQTPIQLINAALAIHSSSDNPEPSWLLDLISTVATKDIREMNLETAGSRHNYLELLRRYQ